MVPNDDNSQGEPAWHAPVCLRQDLQLLTIRRGMQVTHVIKDPVNLKYFEFDEHEIALIRQLDGRKTWDEVCRWFDRRFPPLRLSHQSLHAMLWRLNQQGLLLSIAPGNGARSTERIQREYRRAWLKQISQPWVIRLPGINPGPFMWFANCLFGWIFSPPFVLLASVGFALLGSLAFAKKDALLKMSPAVAEFFTPENLMLLAVVIAVTKVCHELGHAVAAYRHGCQCHEMGLLLLAGLPSLYCDVSDAWFLPGRWQRIVISLAGIWVEMLIAAVALVIWATSVPGIVHAVCLNLMVVCTAGTILFNANPLVRYDGYYVLMDLTGVSNLAQRSQEGIQHIATKWIYGTPDLRPLDAQELPHWCLAYGVASAIYRVFLTGAILWALHLALKPAGLSSIVWTLAAIGLTGWGFNMIKTSTQQARRSVTVGTPLWRVIFGLTTVGVGFVACTMIPLPWYVFGDAVMQPADQQTLVTAVAGKIVERKESGVHIETGDVIARLENQDIDRELRQLKSELLFQEQRLLALHARRNQDVKAAEQIPGAEAIKGAIEHRLNLLVDEQHRLELRATETTTVYPSPLRRDSTEPGELPQWSGNLLDPVNRDAWVNAGDHFCQIGSASRMEAVAILAQDDLESVTVGQPVDILLKSSGSVIQGEVAKVSAIELDAKDETTVAALIPQSTQPQRKTATPQRKWYQVQIRCKSELPEGTMIRSRSKIRIHVGSRSLGEWIANQFFKTFRWHA